MGFGRVCCNQSIHQTHSKTTSALLSTSVIYNISPDTQGVVPRRSRRMESNIQANCVGLGRRVRSSGRWRWWSRLRMWTILKERRINITRVKMYTELLAWWGRVLPCLSPPLFSPPQVQNWSQTSSKLITEYGKTWTCVWRIRTPEWSGSAEAGRPSVSSWWCLPTY